MVWTLERGRETGAERDDADDTGTERERERER
jgi:hypothetical protein